MRMSSRDLASEPETTRTAQPWAIDWGLAAPYSDALHGELRRRIAAYLAEALAKPIALYP